MTASPEFPDLTWIPPRSFTKGRAQGPPRFITIHYTAGHEGYLDAENGAAYDQKRLDGTSSHFYVDADSVVQCVRTEDTSHTALRHGNWWGIHLELCGTAQTRDQWLDEVSRATVRNAASIAARCMAKWGIPLLRVKTTELRDLSARGVCGHVDWTLGWPEDGGTHTDPGAAFVWDVLFADIKEFQTQNGSETDVTTPLTSLQTSQAAWLFNLVIDNMNLLDNFVFLKRGMQQLLARPIMTAEQLDELIQAVVDAPDNPLSEADMAAVAVVAERVLAAQAEKVRAEIRDAVADLGEGGAEQVRADAE